MSRFKLWLAVLLLGGLAFGLLPSAVVATDCTNYSNSWTVYDFTYNVAWCTSHPNTACGQCNSSYYPIGYTVCTFDTTGIDICIDYQF